MSGKVVPVSGSIQFRSNVASNAVRQVFGEASSNLRGLIGSNYSDGTQPPPVAPTLSVPSGNLNLSFFRGKSIFIAPPTTLTVATPMNVISGEVNLNIYGGDGTTFGIAIGSTPGASNITSGWTTVSAGAGSLFVSLTSNTDYYLSVYGINDDGALSLRVNNVTPVVSTVPPAPTGVTFSAGFQEINLTNVTIQGNSHLNTGYGYYLNIGSTFGGSNYGNSIGPRFQATEDPITIIGSIPNNSTVYLRIRASNALGFGAYFDTSVVAHY